MQLISKNTKAGKKFSFDLTQKNSKKLEEIESKLKTLGYKKILFDEDLNSAFEKILIKAEAEILKIETESQN